MNLQRLKIDALGMVSIALFFVYLAVGFAQ